MEQVSCADLVRRSTQSRGRHLEQAGNHRSLLIETPWYVLLSSLSLRSCSKLELVGLTCMLNHNLRRKQHRIQPNPLPLLTLHNRRRRHILPQHAIIFLSPPVLPLGLCALGGLVSPLEFGAGVAWFEGGEGGGGQVGGRGLAGGEAGASPPIQRNLTPTHLLSNRRAHPRPHQPNR